MTRVLVLGGPRGSSRKTAKIPPKWAGRWWFPEFTRGPLFKTPHPRGWRARAPRGPAGEPGGFFGGGGPGYSLGFGPRGKGGSERAGAKRGPRGDLRATGATGARGPPAPPGVPAETKAPGAKKIFRRKAAGGGGKPGTFKGARGAGGAG